MSHSSNDNEPHAAPVVDAHGQAAMLLVESLIHGLIEKSVITVAEAVDIVDTAIQVSQEMVDEAGNSPTGQRSAALLLSISRSLSFDLPPTREL